MPNSPAPQPKKNVIRRFFSVLGPGLITGAADDDPSGIATYSIAGAQMGTSMLWTAFITWPLMGCVQMTCARIGMVTGQGLAAALAEDIASLGSCHCIAGTAGREHDQCRSRPGRYVGRG